MMDMSVEKLLAEVVEFQRSHHFGKYRGLVTDVSDSDNLGRIKAEVPAIYGDQISPWCMPSVPFAGKSHGVLWLPEIGGGVWIEFEGGNPARPIWSGCWWADGQLPDTAGAKQRLFETSAGHQLLFDEEADEIKLVHPGGAELIMGKSDITLKIGKSSLKLSASEINANDGIAKLTTAGASLVNDAFKVGS